jgi:D-alanyl-D-alanine carboxypeptidase
MRVRGQQMHCAALLALFGLLALADTPSAATENSRSVAADAIVEAALKDGPFPGISVAIEQRGKVVYSKGFGFGDLERHTPVTPAMRFPIGSITKSFTCLSVMQLVNKGAVDLDKPAGVYLPHLPAPSRDVKVRNLLNHTSGIPNYTDLPEFPMDKPVGLTRDQMLGYFAAKPLQFPSGTRFSYTNSGTYLLGLIIEASSGQPYDQYVTAHVLKPFGMSQTAFDAHDDDSIGRARGYRLTPEGFKRAQLYDFEVPFSAGSVVSTAGDLLKYREGVFGAKSDAALQKRVLSQDPLAGGQINPYALGCLIETELGDHRKITHAGDIFGFAADYAYYPDDDLTIAILTNSDSARFPPITIEHRLARVFLDVAPPTRVDLTVPADVGARLAGDYEVGAFRFGVDTLGFVYADAQLAMRIGGVNSGGPTLPLRYQGRYQGNNRFVSAIDDEHVLVFEPQPDGAEKVLMHYYEGVIDATKPAAQ